MSYSIPYRKEIPVIAEYDVLVVGGGPSGFVAAISAARSGKRTAIVERYGFFGGTAVAGYVLPISGFFFKEKQVVGGIAWEFVRRLEAKNGAIVEYPRGDVSFHPETYKVVAETMLEECGVTRYTNSTLVDCLRDGSRITHVIVNSKNGLEAIAAKTFVDASGDADLFHMAGAPMLPPGESRQPLSLCFVIENVDVSTPLLRDCIHHDGKDGRRSCNFVIRDYLLSFVEKGEIPQFGGPWFNSMVDGRSLAVNVTRTAGDACDRDELTKAEMQLRRDMFALVDALKKGFPEFKDCAVTVSGFNAGIRETRHIKGVTTMTLDDVLAGNIPEIPVAHCAHPMDIHSAKGAGQSLTHLEKNVFIPYEATVSEALDNVVAAGRTISAAREPYASIRVQATAMSIGEAAGIIASLAIDTDTPVFRLPREELKKRIISRNFVL